MYLIAQKNLNLRQTEIEIVKKLCPEIQIAECESWDCTLMEMIQTGKVEFLFLDVLILGFSWATRIKDLLQTINDTRLILTANHIDKDTLLKAFDLGLWSFIPDEDILQNGNEIFNLILKNGRYFPVSLLNTKEDTQQTPDEIILPSGDILTKRQREVLNYLQKGLSNKQIAGKMNISEPTVKLHIHGLFHKLHAINRTQIVLKAAELGLNSYNNLN